MKAVYAIALFSLLSLGAQAQTMSITLLGGFATLPDGGTFPIGPVPYGTTQAVTFSIKNASSATADLILTKDGSDHYVTLSGSALPYVTLDESATTGDIVAGSSTSFTVTNSAATPPGDYSLTLSIINNDGSHNPYTGTVTYTVSPPTAVIAAKEVGLTLSPNPSTDGRINVNANNLQINQIIVYGTNGMSEPFENTTSFHTRQKGILLVHVYTDKGIIEDKLMVQ